MTQAPIKLIAIAIEKVHLMVACGSLFGLVHIPAPYQLDVEVTAIFPFVTFVIFTVWKPAFGTAAVLLHLSAEGATRAQSLPDVISRRLTRLRVRVGESCGRLARYLQRPDLE